MSEIVTLIETVGFPIIICLCGGYFLIQMVSKMFTTLINEAKSDKELLKSELEYNRKVGTELLDTNKLLAQDLTNKVDNLGDKIDNLIEQNKK